MRKEKDQLNGKEDLVATLQYDCYYEDYYKEYYKDVNDACAVNFRYGEHIDKVPYVHGMSNDMFKPEAEKTKQVLKFYKRSEDSFFERFFKYFY